MTTVTRLIFFLAFCLIYSTKNKDEYNFIKGE